MKKIYGFAEIKTHTKFLSVLCLVGIMLAVGSCTTMTPTQILSPDYEPTNQDGYVYGRFFVKREALSWWAKPPGTSSGSKLTISIVVQNIDTEEMYGLALENKENKIFQLTALPPGNYQVDRIEYLDGSILKDSKDFRIDGYQRDFVIEANTAVYMGDFSGNTKLEVSDGYVNTSWQLHPPTDNYDTTTAAIKEKYPLLTEPPITFVSNMEGFSPTTNNLAINSIPIFFMGIESNDLDLVKRFIRQMGFNINTQDSDGWTGLMYAARDGQTEMLEYLLSEGADLTIKNNKGDTALMQTTDAAIIALLTTAGAIE